MLKKTITYVDYNDVTRTEDFYFNISNAELLELEVSVDGGYANMLRRISEENDVRNLVRYFKDIILLAYGEKSDDGKKFVKSDEISNGFYNSAAYSELIDELLSDTNAAVSFVNGIMPTKPFSFVE